MKWQFITVAILVATLAWSGSQADDPAKPEEPRSYGASNDNKGMISAPVTYTDTMLILVTKKGVAAVKFGEKVDQGVRYRFRFQPADGSNERTGEGAVWENYLDGKYDGGKLTLRAGGINIGWSHGGDDRGWFYYQPEELRLQVASAERFEEYTGRLSGKKVEKLDLKRFLELR